MTREALDHLLLSVWIGRQLWWGDTTTGHESETHLGGVYWGPPSQSAALMSRRKNVAPRVHTHTR